MSAQFINSGNQSLLWKVINNTPQMINYFINAPNGEKERWFQTLIGHVYKQYNGQNISLRDMNKRAIDFMLQSLTPQCLAPQQQSNQQHLAPQQQPLAPQQTFTHQASAKNREQQLTDQFTRRQAEYESMVKKEIPTPHFTENMKDEAILDLDSAVKEYMKQRNQDVEILPLPLSPSALSPSALPPSTLPSSSSILKLDLKNAEPISLAVEELLPKKVQWGENVEHIFDKNDSIVIVKLEKDISEMKSKLDEIIALLQK